MLLPRRDRWLSGILHCRALRDRLSSGVTAAPQHQYWLSCKAERQLLGSQVLVQPGTPGYWHPTWDKAVKRLSQHLKSIRCTTSAIHSCQTPRKALTSLQRVLSCCKTEALAKEQVTHSCALSLRHGSTNPPGITGTFWQDHTLGYSTFPKEQAPLGTTHTDFSDRLQRWTMNSSEPSRAGNQVHPHIAPPGWMGTSPPRHPAAPGSPGWDGDEHKQLRLWVALGTLRTGFRACKQH